MQVWVDCMDDPERPAGVEWGVPVFGGKARPPRVSVYGLEAADKEKENQNEPAKPSELDSQPDDEADNQKRDDILRQIFS